MKSIAILGLGRVGQTVAASLKKSGWVIHFGSRAPQTAKGRLRPELADCKVTTLSDAVAASPIVLMAVPWQASMDTIQSVSQWKGKIVIDCSNPLNAKFDGLCLGFDTSAAEQIAQNLPHCTVLKTLNTASTDMMAHPTMHGEPAAMFYCGGTPEAKQSVAKMLSDIGFEPVDAGPLKMARYLEPLAMLYIEMAVRGGYGSQWGLKLLRQPQ